MYPTTIFQTVKITNFKKNNLTSCNLLKNSLSFDKGPCVDLAKKMQFIIAWEGLQKPIHCSIKLSFACKSYHESLYFIK